MKTAEQQAAEQQAADLQKANEMNKRLEAIVGLTAEERAHFDKMATPAEQDAFLALNSGLRKVAIQKAAEANAVGYTAADGTEYRKSDDPRLIKMAQQADADRLELRKSQEAAATAEFKKTAATDLAHLPGTEDEKVAMLKAISAIPDEAQRDAALKALKAGSSALSKNFKPGGTSDPGAGGSGDGAESAQGLLDAAVQKHATEKNLPLSKAYVEVLSTAEGAKLYDAAEAAKSQRPN